MKATGKEHPEGAGGHFGAQLQKVERCQPVQGKGRRAIDGPGRGQGACAQARGPDGEQAFTEKL